MPISIPQNRPSSNHGGVGDFRSLATSSSAIAHQAEERLKEAGEIVKTVIAHRPMLALGAALTAGVFLGWLIKRR